MSLITDPETQSNKEHTTLPIRKRYNRNKQSPPSFWETTVNEDETRLPLYTEVAQPTFPTNNHLMDNTQVTDNEFPMSLGPLPSPIPLRKTSLQPQYVGSSCRAFLPAARTYTPILTRSPSIPIYNSVSPIIPPYNMHFINSSHTPSPDVPTNSQQYSTSLKSIDTSSNYTTSCTKLLNEMLGKTSPLKIVPYTSTDESLHNYSAVSTPPLHIDMPLSPPLNNCSISDTTLTPNSIDTSLNNTIIANTSANNQQNTTNASNDSSKTVPTPTSNSDLILAISPLTSNDTTPSITSKAKLLKPRKSSTLKKKRSSKCKTKQALKMTHSDPEHKLQTSEDETTDNSETSSSSLKHKYLLRHLQTDLKSCVKKEMLKMGLIDTSPDPQNILTK